MNLRERWQTSRFEATVYDAVVERERLARVLGQVVWGTDTSAFYSEIARLSEQPTGAGVLDIPCGGGVAFRALRPEQRLRYVAADISPLMLERARAEASRRGLDWIEFAQADVEELQFEDGEFDLCVTFTGLHCFPDPALAVWEIARVLRAGGELRGTTVVRKAGLRQEAIVRLMQLGAVFGPGLTSEELRSALEDAGLVDVEIHLSGALAHFSGRKPTDAPGSAGGRAQ